MASFVSFEAKIVGVMFYQAAIRSNLNFVAVKLQRERRNIHDSNSILVTTKQGDALGHLDRQTAAAVARIMDNFPYVKFAWLVLMDV